MPRCKHCKSTFTPKHFNQKNCMETDECVGAFLSDLTKANNTKWRKEKKERKEALKTRSEWMQDLQDVFNTFIRTRDKDKPCISCGTFTGKMNAGHYKSVGGSPELRFNELNVHKQCEYCNTHLSANLIEYRIGLVKRIGVEQVEFLERKDHAPLKLTVDEIKEQIKVYRDKIKLF
jgi:Bacteriophage Lambda NinG protein